MILSLQLSFAVVPLVSFTSDRAKMGEFANPAGSSCSRGSSAIIIAVLNAWLLVQTIRGWTGAAEP